ncbi:MAG: site-specific DNA-methyltransferase [Methanomicrobiales archaeon]|nr:site-specific DNA-methyltransferase [Methanomicrobiales archaeon]
MTKEILDSLRSIDGFPIGKDEDIIALSDPPFYTACPNPWITEFIETYGTPYDPNDGYNREPFASDVSQGRTDPVYLAHTYHTKVPHKAIMRYILHYTNPGDIVFDGFCGSGMVGIAVQMCGSPDPEFQESVNCDMPNVQWGSRRAIICDLSPAATFIAYNYSNHIDSDEFKQNAQRVLQEITREYGWMYETYHQIDGQIQYRQEIDGSKKPIIGLVNFIVWSDIFICPNCSNEMIYWNVAVDKEKGVVLDEITCSSCGAKSTKRTLERSWEIIFDKSLNETVKRAKQYPVLINYSIINEKGKEKRFEKSPDDHDIELIKRIDSLEFSIYSPVDKIPEGYNTAQPRQSHGIAYVNQFFTRRNLFIISGLWDKYQQIPNKIIKGLGYFSITAALRYLSRMSKIGTENYFKGGGGPINVGLLGTLYVPSFSVENSVIKTLNTRYPKLFKVLESFSSSGEVIITSQSNSNLSNIPNNCVDYIFTDPPFGGNLMYSELNFLWEAWLKVFTNNQDEAIINDSQYKDLFKYQQIMEKCFHENYRILKPGRWITVEFHNSKNSVWIAIQESLLRAKFVIADVRTLNKQQGTFKQVTTTSAVKQDLIISAYKPSTTLEQTFTLTAGTEDGVWAFTNEHLRHLPVVVEKEGIIETIAERQNYLLFDRMVAFHVQRGITVPISSAEFYAGLAQRYPERDTMYFLPEQVEGYESARLQAHDVGQLSIFVHDERSAVQWLRQELATPQTYQEIQPAFLRQLHQDSHEALPELSDVLEENFLKDDQGKWYVPNPSKTSDLEKIRERSLLREFGTYVQGKGKLKLFRSEAVRAGFAKAWKERDYGTIVSVGKRLPPKVLQEDDQLLMYFDNAVMRGGE